MAIRFLNTATFTSNVGIGVTSNSAGDTNNGVPKLQVGTTTAVLGEFPLAARFTTNSDAGDNSGVSVLINSGNDRGLMISAGRQSGNVAKVTLNVVENNGTELSGITILQNGSGGTSAKVGIGTAAPASKLDVEGEGRFKDKLLINGVDFDYASLESTAGHIISRVDTQDGLFDYGNSALYIESGKVGIGTPSPAEKLSISSTTFQIGLDTGNISVYGKLQVGHFTNGAYIGTLAGSNAASDLLRLGTSGSEKMRITKDGTVIIGAQTSGYNTAQGYGFHVVSDVTSQSYISVARKGTAPGTQGVVLGLDTANAYLLVRDNIPLILGTNNNTKMFILPGGNVGIGSSNPAGKLDIGTVAGNQAAILASQHYARVALGPQGSQGDVNFGSSGNGDPTIGSQDYGFYAAHNAYRSSTGAWKHTRTSTIPAVRLLGSGGVSSGNVGFSFDYSANNGTNNITWTNLMQILPSGNVGIGTDAPSVRLTLRRESNGNIFSISRPASNTSAYFIGISGNNTNLYTNNGTHTLGVNNPLGTGGEIPYMTMSQIGRAHV